MEAVKVLLPVVLLLVSVEHSECVRCFAAFNTTTGECSDELGEVDIDDCCHNPQYGYLTEEGECQFCGLNVWSPWSSWTLCNNLCGEGVRQRRRTCFGLKESGCANMNDVLHIEPCNGTCCDVKAWDSWLPWSPCSVTCGGVGVRKRQRTCGSPPDCVEVCSGPSQETESCASNNACPVHGGWSSWSAWGQCSGTCIDDQRSDAVIPSRVRQRTCSNPAPSKDTIPKGDDCPGDAHQSQYCSELPNCPVNGNWGEWAQPGPCSVTCGEGLQLSMRKCDNPSPKYGGEYCKGTSSRTSVCQSPCPVHGIWSGWSNWGECSSSCHLESKPATKTRQRSCSNPSPSSNPPGQNCPDQNSQTERCNDLPVCPVDGSWGSWSSFSPCPVTCGVGLQESIRRCDNPAPKYGGRACSGERRITKTCFTKVHCPVHGEWTEWSEWSKCKYPFGDKDISCKTIGGKQTRNRECLRAHNGSYCIGTKLLESQVCYDVDKCRNLKGTWDGWEPWRYCVPQCGENSKRLRFRKCKPDYSGYRPTIGRQGDEAHFSGTPKPDCGPTPDGGPKYEQQKCHNLPPCPEP
uniref:Complement factor properdin n=1 Tax=Oryzias latipes TaxID=8090 RepID=A0A3P9JS75_ORYLA